MAIAEDVMVQVTREEAQEHFTELLDAALRGEQVYINVSAHHAVQLLPVTISRGTPQFGSALGMVWMADDFDAPLDDFRGYME